jgi:hypothetical protein
MRGKWQVSKIQYVLRSAALLLGVAAAGTASAVTVDGTIGSNEYGPNNSIGTSTTQTWYMAWDTSNLYVGISNANTGEGAVLYLDSHPTNPPTGGTNASGNLNGFNSYDGTSGTLPFRSNFVTYFKDGYQEFRAPDGSGGWSNPTNNFSTPAYGNYASTSGSNREIAIPWADVTGSGIPKSFLFFGYLTSSTSYIYGQIPQDNPGEPGNGTSNSFAHYFTVSDTSSSAPFASEDQPVSAVPVPAAAWGGLALIGLIGAGSLVRRFCVALIQSKKSTLTCR